jgi:SAM-dependent methyltransferase
MAQSQTDLYMKSLHDRLDRRVKAITDKAERIKQNYLNHKKFNDHESEANRIWLDQFANGTGFDIACGDFVIANAESTTFGVDGAPKMLGTDFCVEGEILSFQGDNTLDYVVTNYLDGIGNPLKALTEWFRVTKPGGVVAIVCRDSDAYSTPMGALSNSHRQSCYTATTLKNYLLRAGYSDVKVELHAKTQSLRASGTA